MTQLAFVVPGNDSTSYGQEESCWTRDTRWTPALALNAITEIRRRHPEMDSVRFCRPTEDVPGIRAMIFSWIFGDEFESIADSCSILIANPSSCAAELARRFPHAAVIAAKDCFRANEPMDITPFAQWPNQCTRVVVQASTGCPHHCAFCVWDHTPLRKRPELVAQEIHNLKSTHPELRGVGVTVLTNEITGDSLWLRNFCSALGKGIRWVSDANVRNMTREDMVIAREHGLHMVVLGVDTLSPRLLQAMHKGHGIPDVFRAFAWLQGLGIEYGMSLRQRIGETIDDMNATLDHLAQMKKCRLVPRYISIGPMTQWPGNARWEASELHGSARYPRYIRPLGGDRAEVLARWREVNAAVEDLTGREASCCACTAKKKG